MALYMIPAYEFEHFKLNILKFWITYFDICLKDKRLWKYSCIHWFTTQMPTMDRAGLASNPELNWASFMSNNDTIIQIILCYLQGCVLSGLRLGSRKVRLSSLGCRCSKYCLNYCIKFLPHLIIIEYFLLLWTQEAREFR